jgi:hypothetical protein
VNRQVQIWSVVRIWWKLENLGHSLHIDGGAVKMVEQCLDSLRSNAGEFGLKPRHREYIASFIQHIFRRQDPIWPLEDMGKAVISRPRKRNRLNEDVAIKN